MNIFDYQENMTRFEDRFQRFEIPYVPHSFLFYDEKSEFEFPMGVAIEKNWFEQENINNVKSTYENSDGRLDSSCDDWNASIEPLNHEDLDIIVLQRMVRDEIKDKGCNAAVLDCLDIELYDEDEEDSNIIRTKHQKSRLQIKALKVEYRKKKIWSK